MRKGLFLKKYIIFGFINVLLFDDCIKIITNYQSSAEDALCDR